MHIIQGGINNGDKELLDKAIKGQIIHAWKVPKNAQIGDLAIIYIETIGFYAIATIKELPVKSNDKNRYRADISYKEKIDPPIAIEMIKTKIPELKWADYPRSIATVNKDIEDRILSVINENKSRKANIKQYHTHRKISENSFYLNWNPKCEEGKNAFPDYNKKVKTVSKAHTCPFDWICPSHKPQVGDIVYVKRTGNKFNGLCIRGRIIKTIYQKGLIRVAADSFLPLGQEITKTMLDEPPLNATYWNAQSSGTMIQPESAEKLEEIWNEQRKQIHEVRKAGGAGFGSAAENKKVETKAVEFATRYFKKNNFEVTSVESDKIGYDLLCTKKTKELHVEVKGISGTEEEFIITENEKIASQKDKCFMIALVVNAMKKPSLKLYTKQQFKEKFSLKVISYMAKKK